MSALVDWIGLAAAITTTLCWVPQAVRIIKTRETKAISLVAQSALAFGIVLWLIYGIAKADLPLILANTVTLGLLVVILALKIRYG